MNHTLTGNTVRYSIQEPLPLAHKRLALHRLLSSHQLHCHCCLHCLCTQVQQHGEENPLVLQPQPRVHQPSQLCDLLLQL